MEEMSADAFAYYREHIAESGRCDRLTEGSDGSERRRSPVRLGVVQPRGCTTVARAADIAALGYAGTAAAPPTIPLALGLPLLVILGCASGLCLREGLIDLEAAAPQRVRGALTGTFYTVTYIGFGLPLLLTLAGSTAASAIILAVMAVLASAAAVSRTARLRRDSHRQN